MKKYLIGIITVLLSQVASAQMMDYGGMMGSWGMGLIGFIYLALASLVFSVIFWLTYNWLAKKR